MAERTPWRRSEGWDGRLPKDWVRLRRKVLRKSELCHVCRRPGADEVDHVVPRAAGGSHELSNLAPIHKEPCHRLKTAKESAVLAAARRAASRRPVERHPGLAG